MKAAMDNLTCSQCGGNDFTQARGRYTCDYCGTTFVPEAKGINFYFYKHKKKLKIGALVSSGLLFLFFSVKVISFLTLALSPVDHPDTNKPAPMSTAFNAGKGWTKELYNSIKVAEPDYNSPEKYKSGTKMAEIEKQLDHPDVKQLWPRSGGNLEVELSYFGPEDQEENTNIYLRYDQKTGYIIEKRQDTQDNILLEEFDKYTLANLEAMGWTEKEYREIRVATSVLDWRTSEPTQSYEHGTLIEEILQKHPKPTKIEKGEHLKGIKSVTYSWEGEGYTEISLITVEGNGQIIAKDIW